MANSMALEKHAPSRPSLSTEEEQVEALLVTVGIRVRQARTHKRISRRELSERSGVSQRYLAQLESGQGNISIGLLWRIAQALDFDIQWLFSESDPWDVELQNLSRLLRQASTEQRVAVRKVLDPEHPDRRRAHRVALIGLRGAGKSTLGRLAGEELQLPFLELNEEIEQASGMAVYELIALYGQEGYRRLEQQALERLTEVHESLLLAVAGGIVSEPETFGFLLGHFHTIWLKAEPEEHMERVRMQGDERPMAGNPRAMEELRSILTSRESLYAQASAQLSTAHASVGQSLQALIQLIHSQNFLGTHHPPDA